MADEEESPGWAAIDRVLDPLYGGREPEQHYGTVIPWELGGPDPIRGLSAYKVLDQGPPHWHIVSYGMTELFQKEEESRPEISGWGFEFTARVACEEGDEQAPVWFLNFLQNLGRYVWQSGNVFAVGHHLNANGPIAAGVETKLHAVTFATPPRLPAEVESKNGKFVFLHVLGITLDELEAMKRWNSVGVIERIAEQDALLITDLARASYTDREDFREAVDEGAARDGSSQGETFVSRLGIAQDGDAMTLTLGALAARDVGPGVLGRLPFGKPYAVVGPEQVCVFEPADANAVALEDGMLRVSLDAAAAQALADTLDARRGTYRLDALPQLSIVVEPTEIKDREGNVVEVLG